MAEALVRTDFDRPALVRQAFRWEYATVAWMLIEAAVAGWAGIEAHSLMLIAFGADSLIELASAGVLIWRLTVEIKHGRVFSERAEKVAGRIAGALLFALALYVVVSAGYGLLRRETAEFSTLGLVVTLLAVPVMYLLSNRKLKLAEALGSRALRADAAEAITCGYLSIVVVVGLAAQLIFRAWWIDPIASLVIVGFLVKEGREAWEDDDCCD
jgi:divalent metal cation (Fe/Co/Zn/Cd) transporter